jgi:hypothetical protein
LIYWGLAGLPGQPHGTGRSYRGIVAGVEKVLFQYFVQKS